MVDFTCRLLGKCSWSLGGPFGVWGIVIVPGVALSSVDRFVLVFHAVAFLRNSISVSLSADGVESRMAFQ